MLRLSLGTGHYWPFLHSKFKCESLDWLGFLPFPHGTRSEMNFQLWPYITNTNAESVKSQKQNDVFSGTQRSLLFLLIHSSWPRVPTLTVPFRELKLENDCPYEFAAWPLHQDYRLNLTSLSFVCQRESSVPCDKTGQKWSIFLMWKIRFYLSEQFYFPLYRWRGKRK